MIKLLRSLLLLTFLLTTSLVVKARPREEVDLENQLRQRFTEILTYYKIDAMPAVRLQFRKKQRELPGTPFLFDQIQVSNSSNSFQVASIKITIHHNEEKIDSKITDLLRDEAELYTQNVELDLVKKSGRAPASVLDSNTYSKLLRDWRLYAGLAGVLLLLSFLAVSVSKLRGFREMGALIERQSSKLIDSMKDQQERKAEETINDSDENKLSEASVVQLREWSADQLVALFSDCYWSEMDDYAHFIWKNISHRTQKTVINNWPYMSQYVSYFIQQEPKALSFHDDPYYFHPFPFQMVDNSVLQELVEKEPGTYHILPPLRTSTMQLPLGIKMKIFEVNPSEQKFDVQKISEVTSSPRKLETLKLMTLESVEQEQEILESGKDHSDLKKRVLSLIWFVDLSEDRRKKVLARYNAAELSRCLSAPPEVIEVVLSALNPKKADLVRGYLKRNLVSRSSPSYLELCKSIHRELRAQGTSEAVVEKAA